MATYTDIAQIFERNKNFGKRSSSFLLLLLLLLLLFAAFTAQTISFKPWYSG